MDPKPGIYQHYKNRKLYRVFRIVLHTETNEWMVMYSELLDDKSLAFVRPLDMFQESVHHEGQIVP